MDFVLEHATRRTRGKTGERRRPAVGPHLLGLMLWLSFQPDGFRASAKMKMSMPDSSVVVMEKPHMMGSPRIFSSGIFSILRRWWRGRKTSEPHRPLLPSSFHEVV